jgi:hypothetical protein
MDEDNAPMAFPNGYVYSREVRCFPSPIAVSSSLDLAYSLLGTTGRLWKICQHKTREKSSALALRTSASSSS